MLERTLGFEELTEAELPSALERPFAHGLHSWNGGSEICSHLQIRRFDHRITARGKPFGMRLDQAEYSSGVLRQRFDYNY